MPAIGCQHFNTRHSPGGGIVAKRVGVKLFPDSRAFGGFAASVPDDLGADGILGGGMPAAAREQPLGRFPAQPAKMLPEFFEQRSEEHTPELQSLRQLV